LCSSSEPRYCSIVCDIFRQNAAAPRCPSIPDPSVYMQRVSCSCWIALCLAFAAFLSPSTSIVKGGVHHGGKGCGLIVSVAIVQCSGKALTRYSSGVVWFLLLDVFALHMAALIGCVSGLRNHKARVRVWSMWEAFAAHMRATYS